MVQMVCFAAFYQVPDRSDCSAGRPDCNELALYALQPFLCLRAVPTVSQALHASEIAKYLIISERHVHVGAAVRLS